MQHAAQQSGMQEWAYVLYAGVDQLWHQRLILGRVALSAFDYIIVTPDYDQYIEDYGGSNEDIQAVRYGTFDRPPAGVPREQVYRFRAALLPEELGNLRREAMVLAEQECRRRAADMGQSQILVGLKFLAPLVDSATTVSTTAAPRTGVLRGAVASLVDEATEGVWRVASTIGKYRYGDVVQHMGSVAAIGNRDIHDLGNGVAIFVELVTPAEDEAFFARAAAADARILAIRRDRSGKRQVTWRQLAESVSEEDLGDDWDLPGPRTTSYCIHYIDREGGDIEAHHDRFRNICKLDPQMWGVQEHYQTSLTLKYLLLVDQVDGTNLIAVELMFRRLQTIEYVHGERAKESESRGMGGRLSIEEQAAFLGMARSHTSIMFCPKLLEHVRVEIERDAKLLKMLNLVRDEREKSKKHKRGKGDKKGNKDEE